MVYEQFGCELTATEMIVELSGTLSNSNEKRLGAEEDSEEYACITDTTEVNNTDRQQLVVTINLVARANCRGM